MKHWSCKKVIHFNWIYETSAAHHFIILNCFLIYLQTELEEAEEYLAAKAVIEESASHITA